MMLYRPIWPAIILTIITIVRGFIARSIWFRGSGRTGIGALIDFVEISILVVILITGIGYYGINSTTLLLLIPA
ncbi:MAG: hypothetical protein ACXAB5_02215, partial [Candidatus Thorarchaeota archaeon]